MAGQSDKTVSYGVAADASPFEAGMQRASDSARNAASTIDSHFRKVGDAFGAVQKQLLVLAGLVAGGAFFKEAIAASNQFTGETMKLSRALGISAEEAATYKTALEDIGSSGDEYVDTFTKFARQVKSNEERLQALGIKTRDANGNLRDSNVLFREALGSVGQYKAGLDQNTYAQTLFGKTVSEVMTLQKLNNKVLEEAAEKNRSLGLTVTKENVEASKAYKLAMNDVSDVLTAVKKVIGDAVMPVFTELGEYFARTGPYVVQVFRGAMLGLLVAFEVVKGAVKTVAGVVFEAFSLIVDGAGLIGEVFSKLFQGDFSGAYEAAKAVGARVGQAFTGAFRNFVEAGDDVGDAVKKHAERILGGGTAVAAPTGGSKRMGSMRDSKDTSRVSTWDAELAEQKLAFQERANLEGSFAQMSKAQELAFWKSKLALTVAGTQENVAVRKKAAELQLAIAQDAYQREVAVLQTEEANYKHNLDARLAVLDREAALVKQRYGAESKEYEEVQKRIVEAKRHAVEQQKQIDMLRAESARDAALVELQQLEQLTLLERDLGRITAAEQIARQEGFEQRRFAIALAGLNERLSIAEKDPDRSAVEITRIHGEIEAAERQHQLRLTEIRGAATRESQRYVTGMWDSMQSGFASVLNKTLQGSVTLTGVFRGMFDAVTQAVFQMLAQMGAAWLMTQMKNLVFGKVAALSRVSEEAGVAGAAGVASMAMAPFPLNLSAPEFGAAMAAAAMSFAPLASAASGYDIPSNVNPLVQAHANEMVLPSKHADVIRRMADDEGGSGARPQQLVEVKVHKMPGDFFMVHRDELARAFASAQRDFVVRK